MADEQKEKSPRNMAKILGLIFVVFNFMVMSGGSYLVYASTIGYTHPKASEDVLNKELIEFRKSLTGNPIIYNMGQFNTNLDGLPRRFVRVDINLEMLDEAGFEEVINKSTESKDAVVRLLNSKKLKDIETVQGKLHLKNQLITELNSFLDEGVVKNVYFSEFVVQ